MEQDLFDVWYQPIYSTADQRYTTMEALSRLKHPELGWINPQIPFSDCGRKGAVFSDYAAAAPQNLPFSASF